MSVEGWVEVRSDVDEVELKLVCFFIIIWMMMMMMIQKLPGIAGRVMGCESGGLPVAWCQSLGI